MAANDTRTCYWPDGSANHHSPCPSTTEPAGDTACCDAVHDRCMANGLCLWASTGKFFRNGCTDPTWESPECAIVGLALPETCHQGYGASDSNQMYYCPQTDDWCCGPAHNSLDCCANDATHFKLVRSEYSLGELVSRNRPTVSQAPQTCPERDIDLSIQPNPSFSSNLSCSSNTSCSSEMAKGAGIGVGVTSAVAVLAVLLSAFLIRRRRRNRNPYKQPTEEVIVQHHGGYAMPSEMSARTAILELPAERPK